MSTNPATSGLPPLREDELESGLLPRLRTVVTARPDAPAVIDTSDTLKSPGSVTFAELAARAAEVRARLVGLLSSLPERPGERTEARFTREPVALLAGHDADAVVALVGMIASGHPVVVLDPRTPPLWQRRLLTQVGARLVVTTSAPEQVTPHDDLAPHTLRLTREEADPAILWSDPPDPAAPALIAFTSGTTGAAKPVVNDQHLILTDAWNSAVATCCYDADDVVVGTLPLAFHAGLTTALHTLLVGCGIRLFDVRDHGVGPLGQFVADQRASLLVTSPAIARALAANGPDPRLFAGLRGLTVAGENVYGRDLDSLTSVLSSRCVVRNRYGASEAGLIAEHIVLDTPPGPLPVGHGVGWTRLDVVREDGSSAGVGEKGAIVVTARHLALGYWGRDDDPFGEDDQGYRTFRTSDIGRRRPDGTIEVTGRSDDAVSIRGYLVDPGEVQAVLSSLPGVRECVVLGVPGAEAGGPEVLLAAVVGEAGSDVPAIRARLRERLPGHMVPRVMLAVPALPRTSRGKIDRAALAALSAGESTRPREPLAGWERVVAEAWSAVLGVDDIRHDADFFALGGDSLAAEELAARLRDELGVPADAASSRILAQAPTLREFARAIDRSGRRRRTDLVPVRANGTRPPLFVIAGAGGLGVSLGALGRRLGDDQPCYALQAPTLEGRGIPDFSVEAMARRHLATLRQAASGGPYLLAGHAFGGLVALEMAHRLRERGEHVLLLALLDTPPPGGATGRSRLRRAKSGLGLVHAGLRDTTGGTEAWRWQLQADAAAARYRAVPWRGRTLVAVADDGDHRAQAWGSLPKATVFSVPGGPLTMLRPPYVETLGATLRAAIDDALAEGVPAEAPAGRKDA